MPKASLYNIELNLVPGSATGGSAKPPYCSKTATHFCGALITDMCRCARFKSSDVIGLAATKSEHSTA
jgi:hypothetical protein